jgi:hypothetical protein
MHRSTLLAGAAIVTLVGFAGTTQAATDAAPVKHKHHVVHKAPVKDSSAELVNQLSALRAEVDQLRAAQQAQAASAAQSQAQVDQMKAQLAQAQSAAAAAQTQLAEQIQTIPGEIHKEVAAVAPKTDKIYYKGVTVTLGGFAAMETVFRSRNEGADISSSFSAIPLPYVPASHTAEDRFTARQSRLSLLAQGDVSPTIHLAGYGEFDFQAAAVTANSNESNSYNPRIRNLYATVTWDQPFGGVEFLGGQSWSLVTLGTKGITERSESPPLTIDAQYVPGFNWARQPQLRLVANINKELWFAISAENPQTTYASVSGSAFLKGVSIVDNLTPSSGFPSQSGVGYTLSTNKYPDAVAKVAVDENLAGHALHAEAYGLLRDFYYRLTSGGVIANSDSVGGGVGGGMILSVIPKVLEIQGSGLVGRGIGRYGSAQLPDVSFGVDGQLHPIREYEILFGGVGHLGSKIDGYVYAGEEREFAQQYGTTSLYNGVGNSYINNAGCETEGGSCGNSTKYIDQITTGFWDRVYSGKFGRLQWGIQYSYTERHLFPGYGAANPATITFDAAPAARENMILTSFRYYPF